MFNKIFIFLISTSFTVGQNSSSLGVSIIINSDHGWPSEIVVDGHSHIETAWLGLSLYPYDTIDYSKDGRHSNVSLSKGAFSQKITVDKPLLGGSFEVAVWSKKVDKVDCTLDYCFWCKSNGFHFDDLVVYKSGLLNQMEGYK